jgi:WD40 repeat protein
VSGSSDKIVRYWYVSARPLYVSELISSSLRDLSAISEGAPLSSLGYISSHTRPVECVDGFSQSATSAVLYTADTMGVIKVWDIEKDQNSSIRWRSTLRTELNHHRTRINEMLFGNGQLWTGTCGFVITEMSD